MVRFLTDSNLDWIFRLDWSSPCINNINSTICLNRIHKCGYDLGVDLGNLPWLNMPGRERPFTEKNDNVYCRFIQFTVVK
jgi:hypothetical protein